MTPALYISNLILHDEVKYTALYLLQSVFSWNRTSYENYIMWFSGKKFRRTRCENFEELVEASTASANVMQVLKCSVPVFCFTRIDEHSFHYSVQVGERSMTYVFRLDEETELERWDGNKMTIIYKLEGDNVLCQELKFSDGKVAHFRREFGEHETKMTVTVEGTEVEAKIYYEVVQ